MQVDQSGHERLMKEYVNAGFPSSSIHVIGCVNDNPAGQSFRIIYDSNILFSSDRPTLQDVWAETSFRMPTLRDNPVSANQEHSLIADDSHTVFFYDLTFFYSPTPVFPSRPKVAILREQGINGQVEMAWAFTAAGFDAIDAHMLDIPSGEVSLNGFRGLAACGGFSWGDVLGAGKGWAHSVLLNERARNEFSKFFQNQETFTLAVCNGCQFLSHLREIIPSAQGWPDFKQNASERFEGRVSMVEIISNDVTRSSDFLRDMAGSKFPVAVAHGEGRAAFADDSF